MATTTKTPAKATRKPGAKRTPAEKIAEAKAERPPCVCGCGGFPSKRRSRFLPGHDAKYHAGLKRAEREATEKAAPKTSKATKAGKAAA